MEQNNFSAHIATHDLKKQFTYDNTVMVSLKISLPEVTIENNRAAQNRINTYFVHETNRFYNQVAAEFFNSAVEDYIYRTQMGYPFMPYEAVLNYTAALNEGCHLSMFFDQYVFTGGAHGNTLRFSETWDLRTGRRLRLRDLFYPQESYRRKLLTEIYAMADKNMRENPGVYFDNYEELLEEYFDPESFYLTPQGVAVYYQQYEIAPYASGIPVFEIPYADLGIEKPNCG